MGAPEGERNEDDHHTTPVAGEPDPDIIPRMNDSPDRRQRTPLDIAFGAYVVVCLLALVWPGYALLDGRIEPRVLGLPVAFAWNIGWVLLTFFVLVSYHTLRAGRDTDRAPRPDDPGA